MSKGSKRRAGKSGAYEEGWDRVFGKPGKMFGRQFVPPKCSKCGQNAIAPEMHACLKCDWKDPKHWETES